MVLFHRHGFLLNYSTWVGVRVVLRFSHCLWLSPFRHHITIFIHNIYRTYAARLSLPDPDNRSSHSIRQYPSRYHHNPIFIASKITYWACLTLSDSSYLLYSDKKYTSGVCLYDICGNSITTTHGYLISVFYLTKCRLGCTKHGFEDLMSVGRRSAPGKE